MIKVCECECVTVIVIVACCGETLAQIYWHPSFLFHEKTRAPFLCARYASRRPSHDIYSAAFVSSVAAGAGASAASAGFSSAAAGSASDEVQRV